MKALGLSILGILTMGAQSGRSAREDEQARTLYFFFTPEAECASSAARRIVAFVKERKGAVRLRPVLLVSNFSALGNVNEKSPVHRAIKELGALGPLNIPLYDEEGLALAERWRIRSVPSLVLVGAGRAHAVAGGAADPEALLECGK